MSRALLVYNIPRFNWKYFQYYQTVIPQLFSINRSYVLFSFFSVININYNDIDHMITIVKMTISISSNYYYSNSSTKDVNTIIIKIAKTDSTTILEV